jgi:hypothetical protein
MKKQIINISILFLGLIFLGTDLVQAQPGVNSNYNGVQVGVITYSYRDMQLDVEGTLKACLESGISSIELMGTGVEAYLGAPENPLSWREVRRLDEQPKEKQEAYARYQEEVKVWRYADETLDKYVELRKKFNDAGVNIHIYKWIAGMSDEDLDYSFKVARALGAIGITTEIGEEACSRVGAAAERAGMLAIFHNHAQYGRDDFDVDKLLALNPANRLNFDIGHYNGSTGKENEIIKDANQVFGQGETPVKEVNNCRAYCREALL